MDHRAIASQVRDLRTAFDLLDRNRDGRVTANELQFMLKNLGINVRDEIIHDLIREASHSGNGLINEAEFLQWVGRIQALRDEQQQQQQQQQQRQQQLPQLAHPQQPAIAPEEAMRMQQAPPQRLILQPLPEQPRDTMTPPMPDQPQMMQYGRANFGRSLAQPVRIPVPILQPHNEGEIASSVESERPHFVQPRSV
uniref:Calcium-binding protein E63-1 n=2 Tax=Tephritidae TaxID=7211 RepID=A0A034W293_BACDO